MLGVLVVATPLLIIRFGLSQEFTNESPHLENFEWYFRSRNGTIGGRARVPGDIYRDLYYAGYIPKPLFGSGDELLRWVPRTDWVYYTTFVIPGNWNEMKSVLLNVRGLDTVASVYFNDLLVLKTHNQFIPYLVPLKGWRTGENSLRIEFRAPVNYAEQKSAEYEQQFGHIVPPFCPVEDFHGECHVNFMRKIQASFSWDWGPSFPTVGISEPLSVEGVETMFVDRVSAVVSFKNVPLSEQQFIVSVRIRVWSIIKAEFVQLTIEMPEIYITDHFKVALFPNVINVMERSISIPVTAVERWWPNGSGKQKLYDLIATFTYRGRHYEGKRVRVGFRTVELVQDYVNSHDPSAGRHFYFKINDRPIFLKGSNWIPLSSFPARNHEFRERFLLESAREANMNALRVWGGGRYETDRFYDLADELGLLIWQDMMFACALYPVNKQYLHSVQEEVYAQVFQVERLRQHPSILLWAGNNENELGVRQWYYAENYSSAEMIADYMKLYNDTVRPVIAELDDTRPFLLSSPTNGIKSEEEGGVANFPADERYGDIHFYNEINDLWSDKVYQIPRCSSEYGVQSYPRKETMLKWLKKSDWSYTSEGMRRRQHHPGGFAAQLAMIFSHFKIPTTCENGEISACPYVTTVNFMNRFVYLSQFHQAIAYKVQTEHYRRWRGRLTEDGRGNTMCALYWQLNDLWAAPTWSTIDFELSWKPAHYFARRFFAPVILSMTVEKKKIHLFVVSDLVEQIPHATVLLDIYSGFADFLPMHTFSQKITVPAQISTEIDIGYRTDGEMKKLAKNNEYILRARLFSNQGIQIGYDTVHLADKLYKVPEQEFGKASIQKMQMKNSTFYVLELVAERIAPFVYMTLRPGILGWFSDNAFTMTEPSRTVQLILFTKPEHQLSVNDIAICSLRDCGLSDDDYHYMIYDPNHFTRYF